LADYNFDEVLNQQFSRIQRGKMRPQVQQGNQAMSPAQVQIAGELGQAGRDAVYSNNLGNQLEVGATNKRATDIARARADAANQAQAQVGQAGITDQNALADKINALLDRRALRQLQREAEMASQATKVIVAGGQAAGGLMSALDEKETPGTTASPDKKAKTPKNVGGE